MMDDEVLHVHPDKRPALGCLPREGGARARGDIRRPALWNAVDASDFQPTQIWGMYPKRFVAWAARAIQCPPQKILHLCSGALPPGGVRVDIRPSALPDVVADATALPFRSASFDGALIDPPYSVQYAEALYGTGYPRPSRLLAEAARVLRPGGRVGILHFLVPLVSRSVLRFERTWGVTTGCGYRIRAFTVFVKPPEGFL